MSHKYTLAHGAKYNVGDYLIRNRAISLIEAQTGISEEKLYKTDLVRNELTDQELDKIQETDAVLIGGGPAYQENFYPGVYPDIDKILDAGVPIVPLGPGWKGRYEESYRFTDPAKEMLRRVHDQIEVGGVRDLPTKRVLEGIGIENIVLAGCPAWYDPIQSPPEFKAPDSIESLVVTSPQKGDLEYGPQWVYLLYRLMEEFPDADRYCSFHHGIPYAPGYRSRRTSMYNRTIATLASRLGYTVLDPSGRPDKLERYREIDMHVGYRVHGHIFFIAAGKPSFLIQQDGRGTGVSESLRTTSGDVNGFSWQSVREPVNEVITNIRLNVLNDYAGFSETSDAILEAHENMTAVLDTLP